MSTVLNDFCKKVKSDYENAELGEYAKTIEKEQEIGFQFISMIKVNDPLVRSMLLDISMTFYHKKENGSINVALLEEALNEYFDYLKNNEEFKSLLNQMSFIVKVYNEKQPPSLLSQSNTDFDFIKQIEAEIEKDKLHTEMKDLATSKNLPDVRI